MDETQSRADRVAELTDRLEAEVKTLFESQKYADYLSAMSKFHQYSFGNVILILCQCPHASKVAGFGTWKKDFGRNVKRGERGITILAPCRFDAKMTVAKRDPVTYEPILDADGKPETETVRISPRRFRTATVFDVSQTEGRELPAIGVTELHGEAAQYEHILSALEKLSPVPIGFEAISGEAKGFFSNTENRIVIRPGMSEVQTLKTLIHEIAHAKLHACNSPEQSKDRRSREVEAESVAYVVCQHFGIDTSEYSFAYVAGWSRGKELPELKASLSRIRETAAEIIDGIDPPAREKEFTPKSKDRRPRAARGGKPCTQITR